MNETAYVKPNGAAHEDTQTAPVFAEMRETVRRSDDVKELIAALIKAQQEFTPVVKDTENEFFSKGARKSKYATLSAVVDATRPALNKHGLTIIQHVQGNHVTRETIITTSLFHVSGQFMESDLSVPSVNSQGKFDPQSVASASTYGRRYAWFAITGTAPEDDDGNAASGNNGSADAAQAIARQKLEASAKSSDPKTAAIAKEGLAKINAKDTANDLEGQLRQSLPPKAQIPKDEVLESSLEAAKDDGLFEEVTGIIQQVREMKTTPAKGSKDYRRIAFTAEEGGNYKDIEIVSWDNFVLSDGKLWTFLNNKAEGYFGTFLCEVGEYKGKTSYTLRDVKKIGSHTWDNRLGD
jgi:ERF superfamily